jgi:hypothetical protein
MLFLPQYLYLFSTRSESEFLKNGIASKNLSIWFAAQFSTASNSTFLKVASGVLYFAMYTTSLGLSILIKYLEIIKNYKLLSHILPSYSDSSISYFKLQSVEAQASNFAIRASNFGPTRNLRFRTPTSYPDRTLLSNHQTSNFLTWEFRKFVLRDSPSEIAKGNRKYKDTTQHQWLFGKNGP